MTKVRHTAVLALALVALASAPRPARSQTGIPAWPVDPEPVLQAGKIDGVDGELFVRAIDAALLPDGGVAVLDADAREIRYFGPDGTFRRAAGGAGEGPGEFRFPYGLEVLDGSVLAWDYRRGTIGRWTAAGDFIDEHLVRHHETIHQGALLPDGSLVIPHYGSWHFSMQPGSGRYRVPRVLLRYAGGEPQDLGAFPSLELLVEEAGTQPFPYRAGPSVAAGGDPTVIYIAEDTNEPSVRRHDDQGLLVAEIELVDTREPFTRRRWNAMKDSAAARVRDPDLKRRMRGALDLWGRPELTPALEQLLVDPRGRLWVVSRTLEGDPFATVYQNDRAIATVDLPEVDEIYEVTRDRIVTMVRGDFDVQSVRVFRYRSR